MQTNIYNSNGQIFDDEMIINDIDELADYVNNRYSLDSDAEVVGDAFSVLILTGTAHNVMFEAFTQGGQIVCGCPALKDYVIANEGWAKDIIKNASLTMEDTESDNVFYAVDDVVSDEMNNHLNYSEDTFMKELRLPCAAHEVDSVILNAEHTLDKIHNDIVSRLEKMVNTLLSGRMESICRTKKQHHTRRFENDNSAEMNSQPVQDKRKLNSLIKRIYNDPEIKRLTSRVFMDDGAWGPFQSLIKALRNINGVDSVAYGDSTKRNGLSNGYRWDSYDGKTNVMKDKIRDLFINTEYGRLEGEIACWGAGSIEDPLERYDMTLQLWTPSVLERYKRSKSFEKRTYESMKCEHLEQRITRLEKLLSR